MNVSKQSVANGFGPESICTTDSSMCELQMDRKFHLPLEPPPPPPPPLLGKVTSKRQTNQPKVSTTIQSSVPEKGTTAGSLMTRLPPPPPPPQARVVRTKTRSQRRMSTRSQVENSQQQQMEEGSSESELVDTFQGPLHQKVESSSENGRIGINEPTMDYMEIESTSSSATPKTLGSWISRVPWLNKSIPQVTNLSEGNLSVNSFDQRIRIYHPPSVAMEGRDTLEYKRNPKKVENSAAIYNGGQMDSSSSPTMLPSRGDPIKKQISFQRAASWIRKAASSSSNTSKHRKSFDADSLADFKESEWTQPDSSYGAAIPFGGWIPKPIRQMIEWTLIALGTAVFVYLIVTTSMRVSDERTKHNNSTSNFFYSDGSSNGDYVSGCLFLDDDKYVVQGDDCYSSKARTVDDDFNITDDAYAALVDDTNGY
jgi:hypothetical protein